MGKYLAPGQDVSQQQGCVTILGKIPIGATGAVGTVVGCKGVTVTKAATGVYKLALNRKYKALLKASGKVIYAANTTVDSLCVNFSDDNVASSTPLVQLCVVNTAAAALASPTSGDAICFELTLSQSRLSQ